jgi:hypothetical protein
MGFRYKPVSATAEPSFSVREAIAVCQNLPTKQSELYVLEYLLQRRQAHGTSIEKLYASLLLQEFAAKLFRLPDLAGSAK